MQSQAGMEAKELQTGGCRMSWLLGSGVLREVLARTLDLDACGGWDGVQLEDPTQSKRPKLRLGVMFDMSLSFSLIHVVPNFFHFYLRILLEFSTSIQFCCLHPSPSLHHLSLMTLRYGFQIKYVMPS